MSDETMNPASDDIVRAAARGVSTHTIMQIVVRSLSFILKAVTIRALGPKRFAFTEIHLGLLLAVATLPARAGFRKMAVRAEREKDAVDLAVCGSLVTAILGVLGGLIVWFSANRKNGSVIFVMVLAIMVEGISEIHLVKATRRQMYSDVAKVRAVGVIAGNVCSSLAVGLLPGQWTMISSTAGPLMQRVVILQFLGWEVRPLPQGRENVPMAVANDSTTIFSRREELKAAGISALQAFLGFFLANGENIVLEKYWDNADDKGNYKLAGNIASLIARCFSESLEEQSFNIFSALGSSLRTRRDIRSHDEEEDIKRSRRSCQNFWKLSIKSALTISLLIAFVGPFFSRGLIHLLYGDQYKSAAGFMNVYFIYLVLMAINGIAEAFLSAVATSKELFSQSCFSVVLSIFYLAVAYKLTTEHGPNGLIGANCMNMMARILYAFNFYSAKLDVSIVRSFAQTLPRWSVGVALIISSVLSMFSERLFLPKYEVRNLEFLVRLCGHAIFGVSSVLITGAAVYMFDKEYIGQLRNLVRRRQAPPNHNVNTQDGIRNKSAN